MGASSAILDGLKTEKASMLKMYVFPKDWDEFCFLGYSWGLLGASWRPLGGLLGASLGLLGAFGGFLGASLAVLGLSWPV